MCPTGRDTISVSAVPVLLLFNTQATQTVELFFRQPAAAWVGKNITSKQQWSTVTGQRVMRNLTIALVTGEEL